MDYILFAGAFPWTMHGRQAWGGFIPWFRGVLDVLASSSSAALTNGAWRGLGVGPRRLLCARRGVVLGEKPRIFTAPGDAFAFRLAVYASLGLAAPPKDDWPPRGITVVTRHKDGRNIGNLDAVLALLAATGLPVTVVTNGAKLTFREQVELMTRTGIMLGVHGAALQNAMFMPSKAVLIEAFPYAGAGSAWRDLAQAAGLFYYSVRSARPPRDVDAKGWDGVTLYQPEFLQKCDAGTLLADLAANGSAAAAAEAAAVAAPAEDGDGDVLAPEYGHTSSLQAFVNFPCFRRAKMSVVTLPLDELAATLGQALDDIGCRDSWCFEHAPGAPMYEHRQRRAKPKPVEWQRGSGGKWEWVSKD
jgi:hypothetical protein